MLRRDTKPPDELLLILCTYAPDAHLGASRLVSLVQWFSMILRAFSRKFLSASKKLIIGKIILGVQAVCDH